MDVPKRPAAFPAGRLIFMRLSAKKNCKSACLRASLKSPPQGILGEAACVFAHRPARQFIGWMVNM
jgi:hypothetical protein